MSYNYKWNGSTFIEYEAPEDKEDYFWDGQYFVEELAVRDKKEFEEAAYYKWLNSGKPVGEDWKFWFDTEKELLFGLTFDDLKKFVEKAKG